MFNHYKSYSLCDIEILKLALFNGRTPYRPAARQHVGETPAELLVFPKDQLNHSLSRMAAVGNLVIHEMKYPSSSTCKISFTKEQYYVNNRKQRSRDVTAGSEAKVLFIFKL